MPNCTIEWQAPNGSMEAMTHHLSLLVFSDLDGTLLSHGDYGWAEARPGLARLRALGAGLVLASSKTSAEMIPLRDEIGFSDWPAIVENGAGILWPGETDIGDAQTYADLRKTIKTLPVGFVGFGDMTVQEVADQTGLDSQAASRARQRQFSEPGVWTGTRAELDTFLAALKNAGLSARQGGRFLTISSGRTKADAMSEVTARLKPDRTIALGDAPNDAEMIMAADIGVIVRNPHGPGIAPLTSDQSGRILRTTQVGPAGWAEAILTLTKDT